jgi:DNA-binding PadR family transcriptional regulator
MTVMHTTQIDSPKARLFYVKTNRQKSRRQRVKTPTFSRLCLLILRGGKKSPFLPSSEPAKTIPLGTSLHIGPRYTEVRYTRPMSVLTPQAFHILIALSDRDQHGYGIMQDVAGRTSGKLRLSAGTLYGLIKRLLEDGLISELRENQRPGKDQDDERRRYYRLTPLGRKAAKAEVTRLTELLEQARAHGLVAKPN